MERKYYIYKITNLINGKVYVGQTVSVKHRWQDHKRGINKPTQIIHRAFIKYGIKNFTFEIVAICLGVDAANETETVIVAQENSLIPNGYNVTPGGRNATKTKEWIEKVVAKRRAKDNYNHSDETKKKMSEGWYKHHTEESFQKISSANSGRIPTIEHRKKISEANMGKQFCLGHKQPQSVIEKRKITLAIKYGDIKCNVTDCNRVDGHKFNGVRYCNKHILRLQKYGSLELPPRTPYNKGIPMTIELKTKISQILKGKPAHNKGKPMPEELKEKLRLLSLGREPPNKKKFSDEQIQQIISDSRSLIEIAKKFNVSRGTIIRVKKEHFELKR